jgi:dihydroneopterin aldolase
MGLIALEGMEFFSYHGYYDEEQKIGNKYAIDVSIETDLQRAAQTDKLRETINYEEIYRIVASVMHQRHRLLEHVAYEIINEVRAKFLDVQHVKVVVSKFNPPIGGVCAKARVEISD